MEAVKHRIVSLGDIPNSNGGFYNSSALKNGNQRIVLGRHEKDYNFTNDVKATLLIGDIHQIKKGNYEITILKKVGFPVQSRIEDFRLFKHQDELYCTCTLVLGWNGMANSIGSASIFPIICKIEENKIILFDYLDLPLKRKPIEKNYICFSYKDELYCVYSLDPLIIFKHHGFSWRAVKEEENGLNHIVQNRLPGAGYLSLSAITHFRDQFMLGFWHSYVGGVIHQGAFILNMDTLDITEFTAPILDGKDFTDGWKKHICYVSGLVVNEDNVEVWIGECDSHTSMIELNKKDLTNILTASPFIKQTPLKVGFDDNGLGDFICMCYALQGWLNDNPERTVKLYLRKHFELFSCMKIPRVKLYSWADEQVSVDLTSNKGPEYDKKVLFGDYKKWYGMKLNSEPTQPDMGHIKPHDKYKDCIVLAPYAAWDNRTWDIKYWILLSERLMQMGHHVVVMDLYEDRCKNIHGEKIIGRSIWEDMSIIKAAKLVIANDSGLAHSAGLLDTPCIVLSGWIDPDRVFSHTKVNYIYNTSTKNHFNNLNLITCDHVIDKVKEIL